MSPAQNYQHGIINNNLENGKYVLEQNYMLQDDKDEEDYNAETEICLKEFPHNKNGFK